MVCNSQAGCRIRVRVAKIIHSRGSDVMGWIFPEKLLPACVVRIRFSLVFIILEQHEKKLMAQFLQ